MTSIVVQEKMLRYEDISFLTKYCIKDTVSMLIFKAASKISESQEVNVPGDMSAEIGQELGSGKCEGGRVLKKNDT